MHYSADICEDNKDCCPAAVTQSGFRCLSASESFTVTKRDVSTDADKLTTYVQDLSTIVTSVTHELVEKVKNHELTGKAQ